jgi:hypothetical protein
MPAGIIPMKLTSIQKWGHEENIITTRPGSSKASQSWKTNTWRCPSLQGCMLTLALGKVTHSKTAHRVLIHFQQMPLLAKES